MGVPRFAELIRTKYPKCWNNEGDAIVIDSKGRVLNHEVGNLYIDGNGLLHPAMQYTFGYGEFSKKDYSGLSEEEVVAIGAKNFMNVIRALCLEFRPERVVLAIDGPAPIAKMIQQRQRRFGAKMDIRETPAFKESWSEMTRRSRTKAAEDEQTYVTLFISYNNGQIVERALTPAGTVENEIYKKVRENVEYNLVEWAKKEGVIWYNILAHDCPLGFEYEDSKWWWSIGSCACAYVWKQVYGADTFINLLSSASKLPSTLDDPRHHTFIGTSRSKNSSSDAYIQNWVKFKEENSKFIRDHRDKISDMCKKISEHLCQRYRIYRECLINTGIGTSLQGPDKARIEWLMSVRKGLLNTEVSQMEFPAEYEEGFTEYLSSETHSFDSNSLTPGTSIMKIIDNHIRKNIHEDRLKVTDGYEVQIVYSDHMTPGEGEHKIMNYIDKNSAYDDRKMHLVYGLDADLFMLCLIRNENLALIRENRTNVEKFRGVVPERKPGTSSCHVVNISKLRRELPTTGFQVHHLDFIFICFMFGNDFLRNVPCLYFDKYLDVVLDKDSSVRSMDFIFNVYYKLKEDLKMGSGSLFITQTKGNPVYIRWLNFYRFVAELAKHEKQMFGGIIRKMRNDETAELKMGSSPKPGHVPVKLQYEIILKCINIRQKVEGDVINRRARYVDDTEGFDFEQFKKEWESHITKNIPGLETDGISSIFSRTNKRDVMKKISRTFFEGMEWTMRYYSNLHTLMNSKSILNVNWNYPYSQAPLLSHLEEYLYEFIQEDARRLHTVTRETSGDLSRDTIFYHLKGTKITTDVKRRASKTELEILNSYPEDMFIKNARYSKEFLVSEKMLLGQMPRENIPRQLRKLLSDTKISGYRGENVFCEGWAEPRFLFSKSQSREPLISISSTSPEVQLLAVLPAQSSKYLPINTNPADLAWMYPSSMPVDFNFKGMLHSAVISLPPPNIPYLEYYWVTRKSDTYSRNAEPPIEGILIDENTDRIRLNYTSLVSFFESIYYDEFGKKCVVFSTSSGLAAMAASRNFASVKVFSNTRTKDHSTYTKPNIEKFSSAFDISPNNLSFTSSKLDSVLTDDTVKTIYIDAFDRRGKSWYHMDSEKTLEDIVDEVISARKELIVRIPSPRFQFPRFSSDIRVTIKNDAQETYAHFSLFDEGYPRDEADQREIDVLDGAEFQARETSLEEITGVPDFRMEIGKALVDIPRKTDIDSIINDDIVWGEGSRNIVVIDFGDGGILANELSQIHSDIRVFETNGSSIDIITRNFQSLEVERGLPTPEDNTIYFTTYTENYKELIHRGSNSIVILKTDRDIANVDVGDAYTIRPVEKTVFSEKYILYVVFSE